MASREPFNLLLGEDSPGDVFLVREALKEHAISCALRVLSDGAELIELVHRAEMDRSQPFPDLMILDMYLPKHNGDEVLAFVRSTERGRLTPVVLMTSAERHSSALGRCEDGALSYFEKPSTLDEFLGLGAVVRTMLSGSKSDRM